MNPGDLCTVNTSVCVWRDDIQDVKHATRGPVLERGELVIFIGENPVWNDVYRNVLTRHGLVFVPKFSIVASGF